MKIFISIVSHGHGKLLDQIGTIRRFHGINDVHIIIKNNTNDPFLTQCVFEKNITIIDHDYGCGFGKNNNIVFRYCIDKLNMASDDYFIVLNPDVDIEPQSILTLCEQMKLNNEKISTINLFRDDECTIYDNSVRHFPTIFNFIESYFGLKNRSIIDKKNIINKKNVDWAAGSFLAFKSEHYFSINGFDESYFMYCEDIDICLRSKRNSVELVYYPSILGIHKAQHANRSLLSRHFFWHLKSIFRFILSKYYFVKSTTRL